jgi:PAS domain S-box-containing protein
MTRASQKDALEALTASRDWLQVTLSSIGDGVITTDEQGRVTFLNPVAEQLTGFALEQAVGKPLAAVFHIINEETRAEVANPAVRAQSEGLIVGLANHTLLISSDATEHPIDDSAAPIRNDKGEVAGAVLVFRDITERRNAEKLVAESETRYRRLFQSAKDGILIIDVHTFKITDANPYIADLIGVTIDDLKGKELWEIGLFKDIDENKAAFQALLRDGYVQYDNLPLHNVHGETVEVEFVSNVYREDHKLVAQCNVRSIAERRLRETARILADENRRKDEFLAMLSHELRNPLAPIRSAVYLLKAREREREDSIQKQAREIIERQVTNLTRLVSDLLELSRIISGRLTVTLELLDMREIVEHALEAVQPLITLRRHEVTLSLPSQPVWANIDATRMEEVVVNILTNAAKYTEDGGSGRIAISLGVEPLTTARPAEAVLRVKDNGEGIDADLMPRIFDLFAQGRRSLDRSQGGLGIGLTLARRLVDLHGGTIEARSEGPQKGSEFTVRLPLAPAVGLVAAGEQRHSGGTATPAGGSSALRVLVVDDNIDQVAMLATTLRHAGYRVQNAYTGPVGLKMAEEWRPHVVLLDIGLPGMDGYEVARRIRNAPAEELRNVMLIAITGYGRETDVALASDAGFDEHLVKPYEFEELERLIAGRGKA